jgi:hypothetical protein
MTGPAIPVTPPTSWLRPHAEHLAATMRKRGHDEASAVNTLTVALIEEAALFMCAYTRWVADPRRVCGEADMYLALAGTVLAAYTLADEMGAQLDDWCALKLRHTEGDGIHGWGQR